MNSSPFAGPGGRNISRCGDAGFRSRSGGGGTRRGAAEESEGSAGSLCSKSYPEGAARRLPVAGFRVGAAWGAGW